MSYFEQTYLEYDIQLSATVTENNAVGPTQDTTLRPNSSLPNTLSAGGSDGNTVYVDPVSGNDANSGFTFALAKKTFSGALAVVSVTRHTIHIAASQINDSVLSETISPATALPVDLLNIQVEAGHTCTLFVYGGFWRRQGVGLNPLTINGLNIVAMDDDFPFINNQNTLDANTTLEWCRCEGPLRAAYIEENGSATNTIAVVSSGASSAAAPQAFQLTASSGGTIGQRLFRCAAIAKRPNAIGVSYFATNASVDVDLENCVISGFDRAIAILLQPTAVSTTNCLRHIVNNCGELFDYQPTAGGPFTVPFTNSLINVRTDGIGDVSDASNVRDQLPLFYDELGENFRLAHVLRTYNGERFPRTSPAVGIGSDAGVFDVTYGSSTETSKRLVIPEDASFDRVTGSYERDNFQAWDSIQGNARQTWDESAQSYEIKFAGRWLAGTDFSLQYAVMSRYRSYLRFWPEGLQGLFRVTPLGTIPPTPDGIAATAPVVTEKTLDVSATIPRDMIEDAYIGWIAIVHWTDNILMQDHYGYLEIDANTGDTITLGTQVRGTSEWIPSLDTVDYRVNILYLPSLLDQAAVKIENEHYTNDVAEMARPWYKRGEVVVETPAIPDPEEWHARAIRLTETNEPVTLDV